MSGSEARDIERQDVPTKGSLGARLAQRHADNLERLDSRLGALRLVFTIILLAVVVALFARMDPLGQTLLVLVAILLFLMAGSVQKAVQRKLNRWLALGKSFEAERRRRGRDFSRLVEGGEQAVVTPWCLSILAQMPSPGHLFATDLDVHRLLYPLLDTCLTPEASFRLHQMLLDSSKGTRQEANERALRIRAIRPHKRLLRELDASRFSPEIRALGLRLTGASHDHKSSLGGSPKRETIFLLSFGFLSVAAWAALLIPAHVDFLAGGSAEVYVGSLFRYALIPLIGLGLFRSVLSRAHELKERFFGLALLMRHLKSLEQSPELAELAHQVKVASQDLKRMEWQLGLLHARSNPVFWLFIHVLLPYDTVLTLAVWAQIGRLSRVLEPLEKGLFEFDVDAAFARFANENPDFTSSQWIEDAGSNELVLEAMELGHPLLPKESRISNSLTWKRHDGVILLTGSNMSGKSTFLRTLGVNALLHNLGAPVCAKKFSAGPIELLCAIRVDDAIEAGTSYFYAEVKRLAQVLTRLKERVDTGNDASGLALFLVDEIFRGTNNRERYIGSWHVIAALLASGGFGIVTTHDLALTRLEKEQEGAIRKVRNMHFRESVVHDVLHFDYLLREGPCPTTNALRIMRAAGLPVPLDSVADSITLPANGE